MPARLKLSFMDWWKSLSRMRKLIWVYFFLLIFEGSLRKWILPQLSAPLLVVRDPIAIWIVWEAYRTHRWPKQWSIACGALVIGIVFLGISQMIVKQTPWLVVIYGWRSYVLPFLAAFSISETLTRKDLHEFGLATLWMMFPTCLLEIAQYKAAPNAWINAGAGAGKQIGYIGDHVRGSGTFSYVAGPTFLVPLAAAFLLYGLMNEDFTKNKKLLILAAAAVVMSVPVTGSRTQIYMLAATLLCMASAYFAGMTQVGKMLKVIIPVAVICVCISYLPIFAESSKSMTERFNTANDSEGGAGTSFLTRTIMPTIDTVMQSYDSDNWLGLGLGLGSNAGAQITTGKVAFLAAEQEFPRVIFEMGVFVGAGYMFFRYALVLYFALKAFRCLKEQDILGWLLIPVMGSCMIIGILEQPTETGFMVLCLAFTIAAVKHPQKPNMQKMLDRKSGLSPYAGGYLQARNSARIA